MLEQWRHFPSMDDGWICIRKQVGRVLRSNSWQESIKCRVPLESTSSQIDNQVEARRRQSVQEEPTNTSLSE